MSSGWSFRHDLVGRAMADIQRMNGEFSELPVAGGRDGSTYRNARRFPRCGTIQGR